MKYYAIIDGLQKGPFDINTLAEEGVRPSTYVWCKGMQDWEKAEDVADICRMFRNRLHDLMHPGTASAPAEDSSPATTQEETSGDGTPPAYPSRFERYLDGQGQHLPTLEEIDSMEDRQTPPANIMWVAILSAILCFPPTGIAAIYYSYKSRKYWEQAQDLSAKANNADKQRYDEDLKTNVAELRNEAHYCCRSAKMWTGITISFGLILYAFLTRI